MTKLPAGLRCRSPPLPRDWVRTHEAGLHGVSLPDTFQFPEDSAARPACIARPSLPACREFDIPLSLMIGVRYQVNPALRLAGDAVGKADLRAVEHLCRRVSRQPLPDQRAQPREPARAVRLRAQIRAT